MSVTGREVSIIGRPDRRKPEDGNASPTFARILSGELLKHRLDLIQLIRIQPVDCFMYLFFGDRFSG